MKLCKLNPGWSHPQLNSFWLQCVLYVNAYLTWNLQHITSGPEVYCYPI